jgi:formate dehydrogenase assembly factor FdhD
MLAVEENVSMIPNGSCSCSRLSPDAAEGLAVGFLVCEGLVESFQEIFYAHHSNWKVDMSLNSGLGLNSMLLSSSSI